MSHFRKKPVIIEAFQWDGTIVGYDAINHWAGQEQTDKVNNVWRDRVQQGVGEEYFTALIVHTLQGPARAHKGDWICRQDINGRDDLWPCNAEVFAATYEPVDVPNAAAAPRRAHEE